jgi:hypothetical protein
MLSRVVPLGANVMNKRVRVYGSIRYFGRDSDIWRLGDWRCDHHKANSIVSLLRDQAASHPCRFKPWVQ